MKDKLSQAGGKIIEMIDFEKADIEMLEILKKNFGVKQNKQVIKALIAEKCNIIKLTEEEERKQQVKEEKAMEYLAKGEYTCPM
jgi:hypothetical protein